jgi:hypothetical protein
MTSSALTSDDEIAGEWVAFIRRLDPVSGDIKPGAADILANSSKWPSLELMSLLYSDPRRAIRLVAQIASNTDDEWVLINLGVGPIEDLLGMDEQFADELIDISRSNSGVKTAFQSVWRGSIKPELWEELNIVRSDRKRPD